MTASIDDVPADLPFGALEHDTSRTSIRQRSGNGWQLCFHQGTATAAFEPDA